MSTTGSKTRFERLVLDTELLVFLFPLGKEQVEPPHPCLLHRLRRAPVAAGAVDEVEEAVWVELLAEDPDEVDDETVGLLAED